VSYAKVNLIFWHIIIDAYGYGISLGFNRKRKPKSAFCQEEEKMLMNLTRKGLESDH
jgi:hypothetical protein